MRRYIGLDLHKRYIHGCEWQPQAADHKERHFRFPNTPQGWASLLDRVDQTCWVALEVTGSAFEVHDRLSPRVERVLLANPLALKRLGSGRHTDRVDAARLAKMLAMETLPTVWVPPQPIRDVRRLLHYRDRLVRTRRRHINQAKAVLRRHGYGLPLRADAARAAAQVDLSPVPTADRAILASALRQVAAVEEEIRGIESELASRVAAEPAVPVLLTITGVGLIAAAALWAVLGDPHRFRHPRQVTRYIGLDPSVMQSGETDRRGRISKNGSRLLRTLLIEVALQTARHDTGPLGQFYARKRTQIGAKKALAALARKVLIVAWRMMLTGEVYRAAKKPVVTRKHRALQRHLIHPASTTTSRAFQPPTTARSPSPPRTPVPA